MSLATVRSTAGEGRLTITMSEPRAASAADPAARAPFSVSAAVAAALGSKTVTAWPAASSRESHGAAHATHANECNPFQVRPL